MKGLELFYEEAKKRSLIIGETSTDSGKQNGDFFISTPSGKTSKHNYKEIALIFGTLTFFHFEQEEAMNQIFEFINQSFENNS